MYDFTKNTPRENTNAEKYALRESLFGTSDVLPAWVADMDIDTPEFVLESVKEKLSQNIIGYEEFPLSAKKAQIKWINHFHKKTFLLPF